MRETFGVKSMLINAAVILCIIIIAKLLLGNAYVWLLSVLAIIGSVFYLYFSRYQFVSVTDNFIVFRSLNPFKKAVKLKINELEKAFFISSNPYSFGVSFFTNSTNFKIKLNMHMKEYLKIYRLFKTMKIDVQERISNK